MKTSKKPAKSQKTEPETIRVAKITGRYKLIAIMLGAVLPVLLTYLSLNKSNNVNRMDTLSTGKNKKNSTITHIIDENRKPVNKPSTSNTHNSNKSKKSIRKVNKGQDNVIQTKDAQTGNENSKAIHYTISLIIPSFMSDAKILVDGKPAIIINRTPTVVKIRVEKKETNHQIKLVKNNYSPCIIEQFIQQNDLVLTPCQ